MPNENLVGAHGLCLGDTPLGHIHWTSGLVFTLQDSDVLSSRRVGRSAMKMLVFWDQESRQYKARFEVTKDELGSLEDLCQGSAWADEFLCAMSEIDEAISDYEDV